MNCRKRSREGMTERSQATTRQKGRANSTASCLVGVQQLLLLLLVLTNNLEVAGGWGAGRTSLVVVSPLKFAVQLRLGLSIHLFVYLLMLHLLFHTITIFISVATVMQSDGTCKYPCWRAQRYL
jgi:hypothetical protein